MFYDIFESPVGKLTLSTDGTYITSLHIAGDRYFEEVPSVWIRDASQPVLRQARQELENYFKTGRPAFTVPLQAQGTPFQQQVWKALQNIPPGSTTTYSAIASDIRKPQAVRAVGTAIGRNPICIFIPCHRVIARDGSLGGFVAGIKRKRQLLTLENDTNYERKS